MRGLAMVGVSHHTAPVDVRERFIFPPARAEAELARLRLEGGAREAVLLSTCNRTELYLHLPEHAATIEPAEKMLAEQAGYSLPEARCHLYSHRGRAAVEHLYRVVASLDSMVLGEAQIQGQVRSAYEHARELRGEAPVLGPVLTRLFDSALAVGGRVRAETAVGEGAASIASAAVDLARKIFGSLKGRRAIVIGAGEMSELALQCFAAEGLASIEVANRSAERAAELAGRVGGSPIPYAEVWQRLAKADILLTATGAPHRILTRETLERALPGGPKRPLFILDIALPRDVDAGVGGADNVFLYDIDDLQQIVGANLERRRREVPIAESIIGEEVDAFARWYASLDVVPAIRALRDRSEALRREEVERALRRLPHLSPEERDHLERVTRQLLNKILHTPTTRLREAAGNGRAAEAVDALRYLFELDPGDDSANHASGTPGDDSANHASAESADDSANHASSPGASDDDDAPSGAAGAADGHAGGAAARRPPGSRAS
ncbi:MAG TPA: glutamyl-tRNA reductase [Longimicrobiales bacterium]|nr:glutamyl-tRNA reductase [Longimicrobiales bacterium]